MMTDTTQNPFRGPHPLSTGDPIFGRDRELQALLAQLVTNRVVLLHSVSGCGKTSLIDAGLRPHLHEYRLRGLPTIRIPRRAAVPGAGDSLLQPVRDALEPKVAEVSHPPEGASKSAERPTFDVLIFDQFEEVLDVSRVSEDERLEFFKEVGALLTDRTRWALFAMREDYLGALEPYLRFLPNYLESRFRLTQLPIADAERAIISICEGSGVAFQPAAAARLAADLATTDDVATVSRQDNRLVEPVYLQVVGRYLWDLARENSRAEITVDVVAATVTAPAPQGTTQSLAPVEIALQRYFDSSVARATGDRPVDTTKPPEAPAPSGAAVESADRQQGQLVSELQQRVRKWFSEELITYTPQGELRKQTLLVSQSAIDPETLKKLEDTYVVRKDVRNGTWYELAHDRLVQPVLRSNLAVRHWFRQPWQADADAWSQEGESRAFLVLRGASLADAIRWAERNPERVTTNERKFLDQCVAEARQRAKLRWYRRAAVAAGVAGIIAVIALMGAAARAREAVRETQTKLAELHVQEQEVRELARAAQIEVAKAQGQLDEAKAQMAASASQMALSESKARSADAEAARARDLAARAKRDADAAQQQETIARNDAARLKIETDAVRRQSAAEVNEAKAEIATSSVVVEAYDALAQAQRESLLKHALAAAQKLTHQFGTVWTDRARQALAQSLGTIGQLYSRNLVASTAAAKAPVLGVGLDPETGCVHYLAATGSSAAMNVNPGRPCETAEVRLAPARPSSFVTSQAMSADASVIATGAAKGEIQLIRASDPEPRAPFQGYRHEVMTAYVSPTGKYLATASSMWSFEVADLQRWPAGKAEPKRVLRRPPAGIRGWKHWFRFFWGETTHTVDVFTIDEQGATVERSGPVVATSRRDGAMEFFDLGRQACLLKIPGPPERPAGTPGHDKAPTALAFDGSGVTLASGGAGGEVLVWQLPPNRAAWRKLDDARQVPPVSSLRGCKDAIPGEPGGGVTAVAFSPDDRVLAVGCQTGVVLLYYLPDGPVADSVQPLEPLRTLVGQPTAMVFSKTSRRLIVGGSAARLEHWIVPTEHLMRERQSVRERIQAAREAATKGTAFDATDMAATLAAIETVAPQTAGSWDTPRPKGPGYRK